METDYVSDESLDSDLEDKLYAQLYYSSHLNVPSSSTRQQEGSVERIEEDDSTALADSEVEFIEIKSDDETAEPVASTDFIYISDDDEKKHSKYHFLKQKEAVVADGSSDTTGLVHDTAGASAEPASFITHRMTLAEFALDTPSASAPPRTEVVSDDSEPEIPDDSRRYFLGDKSGPKCFNCGQSGHLNRDCPETNVMPCSLCGQTGHLKCNCPQELCYLCRQPGHIARNCSAASASAAAATHAPSPSTASGPGPVSSSREGSRPDRYVECPLCTLPGHQEAQCSLHWRVYISSLPRFPSDKDITQTLSSLRHYCYNCSSKSHFGDDCSRKRVRCVWTAYHRYSIDYVRRSLVLKHHYRQTGSMAVEARGPDMARVDSALPWQARSGRVVHGGHADMAVRPPQSQLPPQSQSQPRSRPRPGPPNRPAYQSPHEPYVAGFTPRDMAPMAATPGTYRPLLPSPGDYELAPRRDVVADEMERPGGGWGPSAESVYVFRHGGQEAYETRVIDHRQGMRGKRGGRMTRRGSGRMPPAPPVSRRAFDAGYHGAEGAAHPPSGYKYAVRGQRRY